MSPRVLCAAALVWSAALAACSTPPPAEPMMLDANWLSVENPTADRWSDVEIWLNTYYRYQVPYVEPGGRFKVPLDVFVAAYGQRFDLKRAPVTEVRLVAKRPDGTTYEIRKQSTKGGLAGALEGLGGKR